MNGRTEHLETVYVFRALYKMNTSVLDAYWRMYEQGTNTDDGTAQVRR